jgi:hypothetical protein
MLGAHGTNAPLVTNFDASAFKRGILPKYGPIDTTEGQRLAVEGAARRIDLQIRNAQSAVPVQRSFPVCHALSAGDNKA